MGRQIYDSGCGHFHCIAVKLVKTKQYDKNTFVCETGVDAGPGGPLEGGLLAQEVRESSWEEDRRILQTEYSKLMLALFVPFLQPQI